jgi:DNA recombination-dependent growth factor C
MSNENSMTNLMSVNSGHIVLRLNTNDSRITKVDGKYCLSCFDTKRQQSVYVVINKDISKLLLEAIEIFEKGEYSLDTRMLLKKINYLEQLNTRLRKELTDESAQRLKHDNRMMKKRLKTLFNKNKILRKLLKEKEKS